LRSHETFLNEYEQALGTHSWDAIAPLIEDETHSISNVRWQYVRGDAALCVYTFNWAGFIDGKASAGSGRGTTFLTRQSGTWKIKHEHLGPPA
jgi:ketosteroid isomerase-like protein